MKKLLIGLLIIGSAIGNACEISDAISTLTEKHSGKNKYVEQKVVDGKVVEWENGVGGTIEISMERNWLPNDNQFFARLIYQVNENKVDKSCVFTELYALRTPTETYGCDLESIKSRLADKHTGKSGPVVHQTLQTIVSEWDDSTGGIIEVQWERSIYDEHVMLAQTTYKVEIEGDYCGEWPLTAVKID